MIATRGACPSLHAPMPSGDGLLVRMSVRATLPLDAFAALCGAARRHGNGVMEISARGNLQVRGLTARTAEALAADVAALGLNPPAGLPITISPLAGLEPAPLADCAALAEELAGATRGLVLAPKVSIVLDDGAELHLDAVVADVRLAWHETRWQVALAGDAAHAFGLGAIAPSAAVETVTRLLRVIAARGPNARARSVIADEGLEPFRGAVGDCLSGAPARPRRAASEPLGLHRLRAGNVALGLGLPFGHAHSTDLLALIADARRAGSAGVRFAPGRALLVLLNAAGEAEAVRAAARRLGLVVRAGDPRRAIAACPGAPACASGEIPTRDLAATIAAAAAPLLDGSAFLHLSGCPKGCAHPRPAALTVVGHAGACGLVPHGTAREAPAAVIAPQALVAWLAQFAHRAGAHQPAAEVLTPQPLAAAIDALYGRVHHG